MIEGVLKGMKETFDELEEERQEVEKVKNRHLISQV